MKNLTFLLLFSMVIFTKAQYSLQKDSYALQANYPITQSFRTNLNLGLEDLSDLDRQVRIRKTFGFIFAGLGLGATVHGISMITKNKGEEEGLGEAIGTGMLIVGALDFVVSIPFFVRAKHFKNQRDELQNLYSQPEN